MFDALKAVGWRNRYIIPAMRQAALRNANVAASPDMMIVVELWLWAIFFRFSGEYRSLAANKQAQLRQEAFHASLHDYKNARKDQILGLVREITLTFGLRASQMAFVMFEQLLRPTFEQSVVEAQRLPPLHEDFDLSTLRRVLSQVYPAYLEVPGAMAGGVDSDRQHELKLIVQVAAVGQAQLYAMLTGLLIPADTVLIDTRDIPDLIDVFVSYSRSDAVFVADLVRRLEALGVRAWYDQQLRADSQFDRTISDRIAASKLVVAVWSNAAISSKWVRAEALAAFDRDKLLQVRLEPCEIPPPFNILQAAEVSQASLDAQAPLIEAILRRIGAAATVPQPPTPRPQSDAWYHNHALWRKELIAPAMAQAEPILFVQNSNVGHAAVLLLETFLWGYAVNLLAAQLPEREFEHIIPMFRATAPRQHWEAAAERSAVAGEMPIEFLKVYDRLVRLSIDLVETDMEGGMLETPPLELMHRFTTQSEAVISKEDRRGAFGDLGDQGDALLAIAALAGATAILERCKEFAFWVPESG